MAKSPSPKSSVRAVADELDTIVDEAMAKLRADIDQTVADAKASAAQASDVLGRAGRLLAEEARVRGGELAGEARERSRRMAEEARVRGRAAYDRAHEEILEHPLTAVAAAAGIGLLLGALLARRD